jgi:hypothetical protein
MPFHFRASYASSWSSSSHLIAFLRFDLITFLLGETTPYPYPPNSASIDAYQRGDGIQCLRLARITPALQAPSTASRLCTWSWDYAEAESVHVRALAIWAPIIH